MSERVQSLDRLVDVLLEKGALFFGRAAIVLGVFAVAWLVAGWAQRAIVRSFERAAHVVDPTLVRFIASAVRYGLLIVSLISCLSAFGITATSFAAVVGAVGIAVGLAFQGTLSNFAAGLMLLLFRPFRVGDTIKAGNYVGTVKALELFSTVLVTGDNRRLVLPNSSLSTQPLENFTYHPVRRAELVIPFPLRVDAEQVLSSLRERVAKLRNVHADPPADARIQDFRDRQMNVLVGAWCNTEHHADLMAELALAGKQVLDEARRVRVLTRKSQTGDPEPR